MIFSIFVAPTFDKDTYSTFDSELLIKSLCNSNIEAIKWYSYTLQCIEPKNIIL